MFYYSYFPSQLFKLENQISYIDFKLAEMVAMISSIIITQCIFLSDHPVSSFTLMEKKLCTQTTFYQSIKKGTTYRVSLNYCPIRYSNSNELIGQELWTPCSCIVYYVSIRTPLQVMEGFFDVYYFLKGFVNLKPHWRGFGKSHIYFR